MIKIKVKNIILILIITFIVIVVPQKKFGITITIDAGHGGKDVGAINKVENVYEKDINLKTAKYLKEYLLEYKDVNIIMTRDTDVFLEVYDRAMIGRTNKSDLFISLHMNSSEVATINGAEVYVTKNTSLDKYNKETTILGDKILTNLNKLGIINRGVRTRLIPSDETDIYSDNTRADYYGVIRYSMRGTRIDSGIIKPEGAVSANVQNGEGVPAVLIEHCYLNSNDFQYTNTDEKIKELAKADAEAIIQHYNLEKKSEKNIRFRIKEKNFVMVPEIKLEEIQSNYKEKKVIVEGENISTGSKIKIDEEEYNIVKIGDINGDGNITPADYVKIKNHIMKVTNLQDINKIAADINEDGNITPADYVKVKNHIMNVSRIKLEDL